VDLDGFLERTASGDRLRRAGRKAGGKQQPARCLRKTQDRFAIAFMAKKLLHRYTCVHARVHMYFAESVIAFTNIVEHHACAGVYVRQMLRTSAYTFASRSLQDVHMRACMCSLFHLALGERGWRGSDSP